MGICRSVVQCGEKCFQGQLQTSHRFRGRLFQYRLAPSLFEYLKKWQYIRPWSPVQLERRIWTWTMEYGSCIKSKHTGWNNATFGMQSRRVDNRVPFTHHIFHIQVVNHEVELSVHFVRNAFCIAFFQHLQECVFKEENTKYLRLKVFLGPSPSGVDFCKKKRRIQRSAEKEHFCRLNIPRLNTYSIYPQLTDNNTSIILSVWNKDILTQWNWKL